MANPENLRDFPLIADEERLYLLGGVEGLQPDALPCPVICQPSWSDDMVQHRHNTTSVCAVCGSRRWWPSRTGLAICHQCYLDPTEALQVLANQVNGATARGERTGDAAIDETSDQITA
jgi:hypothetical protein